MIENILPIRLKAIRTAAGLSQREMAERVGVSNKVLSFYEQGRNTPDAVFIARFAEVNQCSADYLLGLSDVKTQQADIRTICRQTGLSEKAVQQIKACCARRYLNRLLEEDNLYALANALESLYTAKRCLPAFNVDRFVQTEEVIKNQFGQEYDLLSPTDKMTMLRYDITSEGNELLNRLIKEAEQDGQKSE